ncbi:MAG: porin family protein [Chlorobiaceae bacterium]|nr:porin family protein [Chlorobiaceae bacterium]
MKKTLLLVMLFAGLGATSAFAKPYVSGSAGVAMLGDADVDGVQNAVAFKTGYAVNCAVGYNFGKVRLEGAVGYQKNGVDRFTGIPAEFVLTPGSDVNVNFSLLSYMANAYYDFNIKSPLKPYLMGGIGAVTTKWEANLNNLEESMDISISSDTTSFAWQLGLGVGARVTDNLRFDVGYRYFKPSNSEILRPFGGQIGDITLGSHNLMAGVRYEF